MARRRNDHDDCPAERRAMDDSLRRSGATGWTTFIPANFLAGILAIWVYTGLRSSYGPGPKTAIRTALTVWVVFWVIPEAALLPLNRFPNALLLTVIAVGLLDSILAILLGAWIYRD